MKTGGRKKGTPNKITKNLRKALKAIIKKELDELPKLLSKLSEHQRLLILVKLLPFVLPKIESVNENEIEFDNKQITELLYL